MGVIRRFKLGDRQQITDIATYRPNWPSEPIQWKRAYTGGRYARLVFSSSMAGPLRRLFDIRVTEGLFFQNQNLSERATFWHTPCFLLICLACQVSKLWQEKLSMYAELHPLYSSYHIPSLAKKI